MPRSRRTLFSIVALLLLVYAGASLRRLPPSDEILVRDIPVLGGEPALVGPGWHFIPRGIGRLSRYPSSPASLRLDLTGERAATSREGARLDVEVEVTYAIPSDQVVQLHRARGSDYRTDWLEPLVREEALTRLAGASYDAVRSRDPDLALGLKSALGRRAGEDGLRIDKVRVIQVAGAGEASAEILKAQAAPRDREVLVIGVDSFDWRILDPLIQQGRMPQMARLIARGARANLRTIRPILSPVIWTSVATGVKPSRHGIVDFVVTARDTGALMPVTSAMRQVPALWGLLSRQGIDVSVVAWWATWPAETVRGSLVTDRVAYQLFEAAVKEDWKSADPAKNKGKTYPPGLIDDLRPLIRAPSDVTDQEVGWFLPGGAFPRSPTREQRELLDSFRTVIAAGETYHAIALRQFRDASARLKMVYYEGPDTASHLFMRYRPPLLEGVSELEMSLFGGIVERYYERQDRFIGEILQAAGEEAAVILVSDHGFKSGNNRPPRSDPRIGKGDAADWHTPVGVLVAAGPEIRPGFDLGAATVLDIAPTVVALYGLPVPRDMDGQPLVEALRPEFLERHPIAWVDSYGGFRPPADENDMAAATGSPEDAEMIEKLRSLGYIGEERMTAHNNRGVVALDEGDVEGAIQDFERALSTGADAGAMIRTNLARAWLQKGDLEKARSFAQQALAEDPHNKQAELILGGVALKRGDLDAAEGHFRRAVAIDPTYVQARSKLGEVLQRQGKDDAALAEFRQVVEIAPLSTIEHNSIGNIYRQRGQLDRAMEAYREALRADPRHIGAYNNLGLCLQEQGKLAEARDLYEKALAMRPDNPILRNSLGTVRALQGDKTSALAEVQRAVEADPNWAVGVGNLATLQFEGGRFPEANASFQKLVKLEPDSVEALLGLALSHLMLQRRGEAVAAFGEVLRRDPDNLRAHIALGETHLKGGELPKAKVHLERAAQIDARLPRVFNSLGEVYLRLGLKREAAGAFRRSLALEPNQASVRQRLAEAGG